MAFRGSVGQGVAAILGETPPRLLPETNPFAGPDPLSKYQAAYHNYDVTFARSCFGVLALLVLVFCVYFALYLFHRRWNNVQAEKAREAGLEMKTRDFALKLVRYFMPSIQIEKYHFRGLHAKAEPMDIRFENLGLELHNGSTVLAGVTGEFKAGKICAIMGPSGAGKTTFMNALCGKAWYGKTTGKVFINGEEADIQDYKNSIGFVPQDDIVHETLTVGEQINASAMRRSPPGTKSEKAKKITEDVLQILQIEHIRNSVVGSVEYRGISGGQRKRVNIGLELAADPTVLFLDEPTSGLDSTSSLTIAHSLKKLGELGMTSIMVIHQPRYSLFTLFDEVLLLGKGGRTVYMGPSLGAVPYFQRLGFEIPANENPADWLMDLISGEIPTKAIRNFDPTMLFDLWEQNKQYVEAFPNAPGRSWARQDDKAALANLLKDEWRKIDTDKSGFLEPSELSELLQQCTGARPDEEAVKGLIKEMAISSESTSVGVSQQDFITYMCSLSEDASLRSYHDINTNSDHSEGSSESEDESLNNERHLNRSGRGRGLQFLVIMHTQLVLFWRKNPHRALFLGILAFASVILAVFDKYVCPSPTYTPTPYLNLQTALALMTSVYCLGLFGDDKPVFWRECSSGMSVLAFFVARVVANSFDLVMQSFVFSAIYFLWLRPRTLFAEFYWPFLLVSFVSAGIGYLISGLLPKQHGPFVASLVAFVSCGLLGHPLRVVQMTTGGGLEASMDFLSVTRWSVAMSFINVLEMGGIPDESSMEIADRQMLQVTIPVYKDQAMWQPLGVWRSGSIWLLGMAAVLHILAFLALKFTNRTKQV